MKSNPGDYNEITLTKDTWGDKLWDKVGEVLHILTQEGNICVVYNDEVALDIIVVQYQHNDNHPCEHWGVSNPHWLTAEEVEDLETLRSEEKNSFLKVGEDD